MEHIVTLRFRVFSETSEDMESAVYQVEAVNCVEAAHKAVRHNWDNWGGDGDVYKISDVLGYEHVVWVNGQSAEITYIDHVKENGVHYEVNVYVLSELTPIV